MLALASFATATQTFAFSGVLGEMAHDLGVPVAQAGQLATAFALVFALSAPPVAARTAWVPRRTLLTAALLLLGALNLLTAVVPSFAALFLLRMLSGAVAATVIPAASAAAATLAAPARRGRALATVISGTTVALLFGIPMGSVIGGTLGWRGTFAFTGIIAILAGLGVRLLLPALPGEPRGAPRLSVLRRPGIRGALLVTYTAFAAGFCVTAYIGPAVNRVSGLTGAQVAMMQVLAGVVSLVALPLGARLADRGRFGAAAVLVATLLAALLAHAALLGGAADGTGLATLAQCVVLVFSSGSLFALAPLVQARLVGLAGEARGVALAFNAAALSLGQATGAALGGVALHLGGMPALGVAGAMVAACCLVAARRLGR
ncbi:MFS transporter [Roseomonas sp. NAR14]|uniref:MFS transporter n=1 Tax=Roseomonas acroporae TaxID=2937791 RepID=A0A9X1Y5V9_9PROT|nr:MFS transporter [Roseomonas acroporae]